MRIEIKNISKSYDGTPVLENVNMTLTCERPVCLMGVSGRGKTTLFSIILGLVKADGGVVQMPENTKFSAVFQEDRLCGELSALMNVAIVAEKPDSRQISEGLQEMGLERSEIRRPVNALSGGQKRRVAILRALESDSDAILMDEPFKGLDEDTKKQVINRIKRKLKGRLLLVITHDEGDAADLGAEIINI